MNNINTILRACEITIALAVILTAVIITGAYHRKIEGKELIINQLQNKVQQQIELIDALQQ